MFEGESKIFPRQSKVASGGQGAGDNYPGLRPGDIPAWEPRFEYDEGREVLAPDGNYYRCIEDHVASDDFDNDTTKWVIFAGGEFDICGLNITDFTPTDSVAVCRFYEGEYEKFSLPLSSFILHAPTKSGKKLFSDFALVSGVRKATVTFVAAFDDANYTPSIMISSPDNYSVSVESVTAGSFVINLNSNVAPTADVYWSAVKHGEF